MKGTFFLVKPHLAIRYTSNYIPTFSQFILILSLILSSLVGQSQPIQSLENSKASKTEEAAKYLDISWDFLYQDSDSMYIYASKALAIGLKFELIKIEARAHAQLAVLFDFQSNSDSAIHHHTKAINIFESHDSLKGFLPNAYFNFADSYTAFDNFDQAILWLKKSLAVSQSLNRKKDYAFVYHDLAHMYDNLGEKDSVIPYYRKAQQYLKFTDSQILKRAFNLNFGTQLLKRNMLDSAKIYYDRFKSSVNEAGDSTHITLMHLARFNHKYHLKLSEFTKSKSYLEECFSHAKKTKSPTEVLATYGDFKKYFIAVAQYDSALFYYEQEVKLLDSVESIEAENRVAEIETKFRTVQKERRIGKLENEAIIDKERNSFLTWLSLAAVFIFLIILTFYVINRRKSKKLIEQNEIIQESHKEIENLIRESHHRIKNNLQVVSSLLKMQSKSVKSDESKASLIEAFNRVKTIALLHQRLQGSQTFKFIKLNDFIEQLVGSIKHSITGVHSEIEFFMDLDDVEVDTDQSISFGLMVNELITNSIKYAFEGKPGKIWVNLKKKNEKLVLEVVDNGIGFPNGFDATAGKSLGFKIVKSLSIKLKAEMKVNSEKGAQVLIIIPYTEPEA